MVLLASHEVFDALKRADEAISVDVSKVLDEQHVDRKVDGEHPPVERVERPARPLLPPPSVCQTTMPPLSARKGENRVLAKDVLPKGMQR